MGPALAVAASLLLGAVDLRLELGLRTETRGSRLAPRAFAGAPAPTPQNRVSAEARPSAAVVVDARLARLRLGYAPRLWAPDVGDSDPNVDHQLDLLAETRPSATSRIGLTAGGVHGVVDPLADPFSDFARNPVPAGSQQHYESARAALDGSLRLSGRSSISGSTSFAWSGGTDAASRASLPPQRTLGATGAVTRSLSARNQLALAGDGTMARTQVAGTDTRSGFAQATGRWEHGFTPALVVTAAAGASYVNESGGLREGVLESWAPSGELALAHTSRTGFLSRASLRFAPEIDRLTGAVRKAVAGSVNFSWQSGPRWTFGVGANGSVGVPKEEPYSLAGDLRLVRRLDAGFAAELGLRSRVQRDRRTLQGSFEEYGLYVAIEWALVRSRAPAPPAAP